MFECLVGLGLALTALAIEFREPLTHQTRTFTPAQIGDAFDSYAFNDSDQGGQSRATTNGPLNWSCKLSTVYAYPYCGFGILFDREHKGRGIDFSRFDSVLLDLDYSGNGQFLRPTFRNHDGAVTATGNPEIDKVIQTAVPVTQGRQTISLMMSDFEVAEWWKDVTKAAPERARAAFDNVVALEIVTSNETRFGGHNVRIRSVRFERSLVSTEAWYAGIAICWMVMAIAYLLRRRREVEKWRRNLTDRTLNSVPEVIWSVGEDGWPDFVSQQWAEHYGGSPRELLGRGWLKIIHPEDRRDAIRKWHAARLSNESYEAEYRVRLPNGSYRWAVARARPDVDSTGSINRWFGTCTDAHERVLAERALQASERLHRGILEASADCICVLSPDGSVELMNAPGVRAMELPSFDKIAGKHWTALWQEEASALVADAITRAGCGETVRFRTFCPTALGTPKWWDVVLTPMLDERNAVKGLLAISRDITSDREKSEQLRWASEHDALTSLPNRRAFQARLQAATLRAMETGEQIGLLLIDLDHFKHINDSLGHSAGDEVLNTIAERLRESVRESDFVARVGGDEFAIILEHVRSKEDMLALSQKVFSRIQNPLRLGRRVISAGASIGGAVFPADAQSANDLFKTADTALYALKGSGRGGTMLFHGYMLKEVEKAASQLGIARDALSEKTVVPVYQAQVEVQTGKVVGFEALLRWKHPRHGLQLPATVEEAFKDYELAAKIGELMQKSVASDIRGWMDAGLEFGRVSVNASPAEFLRDDYAERLLAILHNHRVPPEKIEVEVTEHALLDHGPAHVARALAKLKQAGVAVSLDDFGTGYSSLSHLRDFPVDLVKIDRSFVQQMAQDGEIASIVAAVVNLARSIDIDVVAEGVETPAQLEMLRNMGCRLAQGHLFGKPMENALIVERLNEKRAAA